MALTYNLSCVNACLDSLQSLNNLYQAIQRRIKDDPNITLATDEHRLRPQAIRERIRKPHLWQLAELQNMAQYYKLPYTPIANAEATLLDLNKWLKTLPADERNKLLKRCQIDNRVFKNRERLGWSIDHITGLRRGLRDWVDLVEVQPKSGSVTTT